MIEALTTDGCSTIPSGPLSGPAHDDPDVLEVVRVHGGVDDDLLELLYVLARRGLHGADVQPRRLEQVPAGGPPARDDVVALLCPRAEVDVIDAEVALEAGLEHPLAVRDVLGGDGGRDLARRRVELRRRHDPNPRREHAVRDEHHLGGMPGDVRCASDERVLPDHHGLVVLYPVLGADVYDDPLGELVPDGRHHPRERPVLVDGPLAFEQAAQAFVFLLQPRGLGGERLGVAEFGAQALLLGVVEGVADPVGRLPDGREEGAYHAPDRLQDLGGPELDRVQGSALALGGAVPLLHVNREEGEAHHAEHAEGREPARSTWLPPAHDALRRGERAAVEVDLLQRAPAPDRHAHQGVVGDVDRDAGLPPEALVEVPEQRAAAREHHPTVHDVRSELRRGTIERVPDGGYDRVHGDAYGLPDLLGGDHDGLRKTRDESPTPDLCRLLLLEPEGAAELYLELLGRLGADGELVLLLDVGADGVVDVVAGDADGGLVYDAAQGDHGDLARPAADVHYHRPLRLVHGKPRPDGRRERLLDGESLPGAGGLRGLLDGPELDAGDARGHADDDARADEGAEDPALGLHLADKVGEHLLRYLEVRDDAVFKRPECDDVARRAPEHALGAGADGHHLVRLAVYGDDRGLGEHDALALDEHERVRRAQINRDVPPEESSKHSRPIRPKFSAPAAHRRLEHSVFLHTKIPVAQDHVIEDLNSYYFGRLDEPPRHLPVLATGFHLAARVVVREHDASGTRPYSGLEDLAGMNQGRRESSYRDRRVFQHLVLGVQEHRDEVLPVKIGDPPPQKALNVRGRGY